jgi:hypothetical protein
MKCGVCVFGGWKQERETPASAACVVVSGCGKLGGADGVLALMEATAANKAVGSASAYCKQCQSITWLCAQHLCINHACVEFWHKLRAGEHIASSLALVKQSNSGTNSLLRRRTDPKDKGL